MRPNKWPRVRATLGRRSGPMTISATTAITRISENPISNMRREASQVREACNAAYRRTRTPPGVASHLGRLFLDFAFDDLTGRGGYLGGRLSLVVLGLHAVFEAFHRASEVGPD